MVHCGFDLCESKMVQFQNWIQCLFLHPISLNLPLEMLRRASDPEIAEIIVCEQYLNDGQAQVGASWRSSAAGFRLPRPSQFR
jgi:hypothetical protein